MKPIFAYNTRRGLDYLSFFSANTKGGIGPYLAIYLLVSEKWDLKDIGIATAIMSFVSLLAQSPAGALVDKWSNKKAIIGWASLLAGLGTVMIIIRCNFLLVAISQVMTGVAAVFVGPAIASLTLGITGYAGFEKNIGRNEMFNHGGNMATALFSGLIGHYFGLEVIFNFVFLLSIANIAALPLINGNEINNDLARGFIARGDNPSSIAVKKIILQPTILIFTICCLLFHFGNAAMLPLAGQYIAAQKTDATIYMSACIIIAQLVMIPVAGWCSRKSTRGRKGLMLICFFILPVRGFLLTLSPNPYYVVSVQIMDGIAAAIFGVISVLIIADLTKGTGHFNLVSGIVTTATSIGASLSNVVAGYIAQYYSFKAAFLLLSGAAAIAAILYAVYMKETILLNDS